MSTKGNPSADKTHAMLSQLGTAYRDWKSSEETKNRCKDEFFEFADKELMKRGLRVGWFDFTAPSKEVAEARVALHRPEWRVDILRPHRTRPGVWEAILKEKPAYLRFSCEHDGIRYARTISRGTTMVDDEWLLEEEPELYKLVTFELPWGARITRPIETLDKEVLGRLTKYIYNAPPRASLAAPREVKDDDE